MTLYIPWENNWWIFMKFVFASLPVTDSISPCSGCEIVFTYLIPHFFNRKKVTKSDFSLCFFCTPYYIQGIRKCCKLINWDNSTYYNVSYKPTPLLRCLSPSPWFSFPISSFMVIPLRETVVSGCLLNGWRVPQCTFSIHTHILVSGYSVTEMQRVHIPLTSVYCHAPVYSIVDIAYYV